METLLNKSHKAAYEHPPKSNKYIAWVQSDDLVKTLKLPSIQREIDDEHVTKLLNSFLQSYEKDQVIDMGSLDLACLDDILYLVNGQHRYQVMCKLMESGIAPFSVEIKVKKVSSINELNEYFMIVNGSKPLKICKNADTQMIVNAVRKHFYHNYGNFCSNANRPRRPNINLNQLTDRINDMNLIEKLCIDHSDTLIAKIEELNDFYRYTKKEKWEDWGIKDWNALEERCRYKSPTKPLFLGIYTNFEWLYRLVYSIENQTDYSDMQHTTMTHRHKITKGKRRQVWAKRNNKKMEAPCFVCTQNIDYDSFECGHIDAIFWGGNNDINNMEPICGVCNRDMGIENLYEYKNKMFPENNDSLS